MSGSSPHVFDFGALQKLPTRKDVAPGSRRLKGCYVCDDEAEAIFVPSKSFLGQPPLWRIDVLQDLIHDFEQVRRHAIVEWAQSLALSNSQVDEADRLRRVSGSMRAARNTHPGELRGFTRARGSIQFGQPPESTMTVRRRPAPLGLTTTCIRSDLLDEGGAPEPSDHAVIGEQCHRLNHAIPRRFGGAPLVI